MFFFFKTNGKSHSNWKKIYLRMKPKNKLKRRKNQVNLDKPSMPRLIFKSHKSLSFNPKLN
jgi:hypothetical protein